MSSSLIFSLTGPRRSFITSYGRGVGRAGKWGEGGDSGMGGTKGESEGVRVSAAGA